MNRMLCDARCFLSARLQTRSRRSCAPKPTNLQMRDRSAAPLHLLTPMRPFSALTSSCAPSGYYGNPSPRPPPHFSICTLVGSVMVQAASCSTMVSAQWFSIANSGFNPSLFVSSTFFSLYLFDSSSQWSLNPSHTGMFWTGLDCHRTGIVGRAAGTEW